MPATAVDVEYFGDPACPWDFSAEGARLRLQWLYGDGLRWRRHMVVLSRDTEEYARRGVRLADLAEGREKIRRAHGMPIDSTPAERHIATIAACRAVVAVRLNAPAKEELFLRRLRVLNMSGRDLVDDPATIDRAAGEAGLDPAEVTAWTERPAVAEALAEDMALARRPGAPALAMRARLATTPEGEWRYTCPSYVFEAGGVRLEAPGFQPARVYEVCIANLAPGLPRRDDPADVADVLAWAPYPLATAEVAVIMELPVPVVRERLQAVAREHPAAGDAYWSAG